MIALLADHLWQSTLFAAAIGLLTLLLRQNSAHVRFGLWFAASVKFLIPFSLVSALGTAFAPPQPLNATSTALIEQAQPAAVPFASMASHSFDGGTVSFAFNDSIGVEDVLFVVWLAGALALLALWSAKYIKLKSIARAAISLDVPAPIDVRVSSELIEPGLVGIWHSVLLLPQGIETRLSRAEMDAIISHEMCHARRRDNLTAAIHMLVQALFWFYPMTWWIGQRLVAERERACDEAVVAAGNDPDVYAEGILKVCKYYLHSPLYCASGIAGADLRRRVETIMEDRFIHDLGRIKKAVLASVAFAVIGGPFAAGMVAHSDVSAESRTAASPGTEPALRRLIESWERHQPDFGVLAPAMAQVFMQHQADVQREIDQSGPLKSITFRKVSPEGWDIYSVTFADALSTWNVAPLTADGKIPTLGYWPAYARSGGNKPSPGTEAALRHQIEGWERQHPAFDELSQPFRATMKRQYAMGHEFFDALGPLKALGFARVDANGWDVYDAAFENGRAVFSIPPLTADGKVFGLKVSPAFSRSGMAPSPGTERSLRRYIEALEKGSPDYGDMTRAMAALTRLDLAATRTQFKTWGDLKALRFRSVGANGLDVYDARFEHGHGVWQIAPLTNDAKISWVIHDAF